MTRPEAPRPRNAPSLADNLRPAARELRSAVAPGLGVVSTYLASRYVGAWAAAVVSGLWVALVVSWWSRLVAELRGSVEYYRRLALIDDLTGLANGRSFRTALEVYGTMAKSAGSSLTLCLSDVDQFKSYNDAFGHPAGDAALKEFGRILLANSGNHPPAYRLGGDEFAVILRGVDGPGSLEIAGRMKAAIEAHPWPGRPITASFGLSTSDPVGRERDPSTLLGRADRALYRAKGEGGNRVVSGLFEESPPT